MAFKDPADINSDNPLHQYRTYSYHHVLIACVSNQNIEEDFTNIPFDKLLPSTNAIGNISERCKPQFINNDQNKPYIIMINTQVDVEFLIKSLTFKVIPAPPPNEIHQLKDYQYARTAFVYGGQMQIDEPFGIRFGDMMSQISVNLRAPPERIVFVLKTAFFGFTSEGASTIQQIKPIALAFLKLDATFDAAGGHYDLEFVPYANGFANRKEISNACSAIKFQSPPTLAAAFAKMEEVVNAEQDKLNKSDTTLQAVKYQIVLDPFYADYTIDDAGPANLDKKNVQFVANANSSVTEMIEKLMMMSKKVKDDVTKASETPKTTEANPKVDRTVFKIYTDVVNTRELFTIIYRIYPHKPNVMPIPTESDKVTDPTVLIQKRKNAIATFIANAQADNNYLEYNYIYTGKNIDIIDFEMKLNLWTTFQSYYMEETHWKAKFNIKGDASTGVVAAGSDDPINQSKPNLSKKGQYPSKLPPKAIYAPNDVKEFQAFNDYLTRTVALSTGGNYINMTIAGDPRLYAGYFTSPFDSNGNLKTKQSLASNPSLIMSNWAQVPALVKINVIMPNPPSAVVQDQTPQAAFGSAFWFDGLFQVMSITNMFTEDGKFTQQLEMLPISGEYNIPDLTELVKDSNSATVDNSVVDNTPPPELQTTTPGLFLRASKTSQLTAAQKKCLAHAYQIATRNGMPPMTLQAILLVDSNACQGIETSTAIVFSGATKLNATRVQNYLKKAPSIVQAIAKQTGIPFSADSLDSIQNLLVTNDDFNLDMCAKIWLEDREYVRGVFSTPVSRGAQRNIPAASLIPKGAEDVTDQATIAHSHIFSGAKATYTAAQDVGFNQPQNAPITAQDSYIKLVQAQTELITEFNRDVLPTING